MEDFHQLLKSLTNFPQSPYEMLWGQIDVWSELCNTVQFMYKPFYRL